MPAPTEKTAEKLILVHFGELWLRGKNRSLYINLLMQNLKEQLRGLAYKLERQYDRLIIRLTPKSDVAKIEKGLSKVFGISNYELAFVTKPELRSITSLAVSILRSSKAKSVKIEAHRSYKKLDFDSNDIIRGVSRSAERRGIIPELHGYDTLLYVNVTQDVAYVSIDKRKGPGGLPVGSGGKCIVLLSGGIDSPVAAWYAMKRGMKPVYVHVHSFSDADEIAGTKLPRILRTLSEYCPHCKTYYVPSHIFDAASVSIGAGRYSLILLKHFMLRLAELVADRENASVIFTGESLGQVASQTPENLAAEEYGIKLPVLRPLAGLDKEEIIKLSKEIGTYDDSVTKYKDVCAISSKNPKLKSRVVDLVRFQKTMKIKGVVSRSLRLAEVVSE